MLKKLQLHGLIFAFALLSGAQMWGQETIAGYEVNGLTGYGASPYGAGTVASNTTVGGITRGGGITTTPTAASNAWGGNGLNTSSYANAVSGGDFVTFTVKSNTGYSLSLDEISAYNIRRSSSGPTTGQWQYSIDGTNFTNIGSSITWGNTTTAAGNSQSAINLAGITALQDVAATTTVTFRIVLWGGTNATGTWYINNISGDDLIVVGTVDAVSTTSNASNIIRNASFSEPANIAYASYQGTDINTSNSIEVGGFTIQDGAGTTDADAVGTTLTAITFNVANSGNIRRLALYDGVTEVAEVAGGATAAFTGLSLAAADGGTKNFTLRASFNSTVTDNQQVSFTVASASADSAGSTFAAANAGAAATATTGDSNRIEVSADRLSFVQQPANTQENTVMTPAVTVSANDANANRDLDYTGDISITSTGTLTGTPVTVTAVSGLATFSSLTHTLAQTGRALTARRSPANDWNVTSNTFNITAAQPEINIAQGATDIATGGSYAFGGHIQGTATSPVTFTISNTGAAALTLGGNPKIVVSGTNAADFTVNETATSASVPASGNTTFTVTFTPAFAGSRTAQLSIANNDSNENPYIINLTGTGTVSAASDIVEATFAYSSNIDYKAYQTATITGPGSLGVMDFRVRDGGASFNDTDHLPTTIESITFSVNNIAVIRDAAIYLGAAKISSAVIDTGNGTLSFSGLSASISAGDGGQSYLFSLRVTFNSTVTDNQQLQFTISSATASATGSGLASANAGGAQSSITGDHNRIEVTADRLRFGTQPVGTAIGANLAAFTVQAIDANANIDLDAANSIALTTSGTGMTSSSPYTLTSGTATISNVSFGSAQNNITLTATTTGLAQSNMATSNSFSITSIASGTYRTLTAGTWPNSGTATWERFTAGTWGPATPGANTSDLLIIRHAISTNQIAAGSGGGLKIAIENNGSFTMNSGGTIASLTIENGGTFTAAGSTAIAAAASPTEPNIIVESGGRFVINTASIGGTSTIWNGNENFKSGSIVEIRNWNYGGANDIKRLVQNPSQISANAAGYYFGNLEITGSPSAIFAISAGNQTINLAGNDFTVNTTGNATTFTANASNVTVGGNVYVEGGTFSVTASTNGTIVSKVMGNVVVNAGTLNLAQNSSTSSTSALELHGNFTKTGGSFSANDLSSRVIFTGGGTKTISIAGGMGNNIVFEIDNGTTLQLPQSLELTNSSDIVQVLAGGIFEFNGYNVTGDGRFLVDESGIIKITSADGINALGASGNVQTATRTFNQAGHYHYVGSASPQSTGTAITSGSTTKHIVIDKTNAADIVNLTQSTGVSGTGQVYVKNGDFREGVTAVVNGTGGIKIDAGSTYRISALPAEGTYVPQVSGTYDMAPTGVLMLNGAGNQTLRGARDYGSLTFDGGGVKTTSSAISTITGTVLVKTGTTLNSGTSTFGGGATNLTVEAGATYATGGSGTKPNIGGTYTLAPTSVIEFGGASGTDVRTSPNYGNVTITGSNVGLSTDTAAITLQSGATFTVKAGATFNVRNTNGFAGGADTAVRSTNNPTLTLEPTSTINYNREGSQTVTGTVNHSNVALSGTGEKTFANGLIVGNNLTLNTGATAKVASGTSITVHNLVVNNAAVADFVVENNGNLIQVNDIDDTTPITVYRDSSPLFRQDYTLWSSPVIGQQLQAFSPGTNANRFYGYDTTENQYADTDETADFASGLGYLIRMPNGAYLPDTQDLAGTIAGTPAAYQGGTAKMTVNGVFTGVPNNGTINIPLDTNGVGVNLLGNPYPSPISIVDFLDHNDNAIDGTVYFWRKTNSVATSNGSSYATCNAAGVYAGNGAPEAEDPNGVIRIGQGFLVQLAAGNTSSTVTFTNAMRTANVDNQFFRSANAAASNSTMPERHGMWLNLTNSNGFYSQMYAGYIEGATLGADKGIDSKYINDTQTVLATEIAGKEYIIQGRPLPFTSQDIIPLSFRAQTAGSFTITIDKVEGLFIQGQVIYLKDNLLGITQNLTEGAYNFTTAAGTFNSRFEILYTNGSLGIDPVLNPDSFVVYQQDSKIFVNAGVTEISGVTVFDMRGRMLYNQNGINATETVIDSLVAQQQVLIVQIQTADKGLVSKKIVF